MIKQSLLNSDDAIRSYVKYSSLSQKIYQALIAKPQQIARLVRIAIDPQAEGITHTEYPLIVCQILQNYPYLLLVLFSVEGNADCLFKFLQRSPNSTQLGYFSKIVSLFNTNTQEEALKYLKQNSNILSLLFKNIITPSVFRFLFDCTILCKKQHQIRSIILMKLYKQIILQPSQDIAKSIKDTFNQLIQNFSMLGTTIKQTICNILDEDYIKQILHLIKKNQDHFLSQYCIGILNRTIIVYHMIKQQISAKGQVNSPLKQTVSISMSSIQIGITQILKALPWLSEFLLVPNITIFKLRLSQFFKTIMKYFDESTLLEFNFKLDEFIENINSKYYIIQKQLSANPWANLIHNQLTDTALMLIQKHNKWSENIVELLDDLMQLFKNRYYILISSGKTASLGNTHHLYLIIKKLSIQLQKHEQLDEIFRTFKPWKKFLVDDLQKYQKNLKANTQTYPNTPPDLADSSISNLIIRMNQRNSKHLMNQFLDDLDDSYVSVVDYTIWDKKKESNK